jgi:2,4-dienoyl-CoA reductase-like NADH-dependent reductase (Old Yellow Enzyme family)
LAKLVDAVHHNNSRIAFQLAHGGRQSPKKVTGRAPLAPSGNGRDPVSLNKPRQMDEPQISKTIHSFVAAARRASEAGADAIQLHAAHGFLINEFLSPFFNRRRDAWGGSDEGRFRFLKEIVIQTRDELSGELPILVKLNADDGTPRTGITPELAATYAGWLVDLGVAAIEVSCGSYYGFQTIRGEIPVADLVPGLPCWMRPIARLKMSAQRPGNRFKEAYNLAAAKVIKPAMEDVPLILVGGLRRLDQMEELVAGGDAEMISMSRPFIREPYLVRRFAEGKAVQASCISCNKCFAAMFNDVPIRCFQKGTD